MKRQRDISFYFWCLFWSLYFLAFLTLAIAGPASNKAFYGNMFFLKGADMFMDFLNSLRDNATLATFTDRLTQYPALAALFFHILGYFVPDSSLLTPFSDRYAMLRSAPAMILYVAFLAATAAVLVLAIKRLFRHHSPLMQWTMVIVSFTVYGGYFAVERGNILTLSVVLLVFFFAYYDHENKVLKELALLALSLSIAIKLYPVLFALFLVKKKDFYSLLKAGVYTVLAFFVPFVIYGGAEGLGIMIYQILNFASKQGSQAVFGVSLSSFLTAAGVSGQFTIAFTILAYGGLLFALIFAKKNYQIALICFLLMIRFPGAAAIYSTFYVLPALLLLLAEKKDKMSLLYGTALVLMSFIFGFYVGNGENLFAQFFTAGSWIAMVGLIVIEPLQVIIPKLKAAKQHG